MDYKAAALLALAAVAAFAAGFAVAKAPWQAQQAQQSALEKIKARGVLVVGTSADWPPYEYVPPGGGYAGIDIEIAKRIASSLGVKLEIKDMKFAALFEAVRRGDVDMAIADIAMKPERLQAVDFTIPYRCETSKSVVVRAQDAGKYTGIDSLKGKVIGVQLGTTEEDLVRGLLGDSSQVVAFDRVYPEMVMALETGRVDAIVLAPDVAQVVVAKGQGLKVAFGIPFFSCSVVAVPQGAVDLKVAVSKVIWNLLQSGEMQKIFEQEIKKWIEAQG